MLLGVMHDQADLQLLHLALTIKCQHNMHVASMHDDGHYLVMRRRMVPFDNVYKREGEFDPSNPRHRRMNPDLGNRLLSEQVLSQFLTWLVRGAVLWYSERLGETPKLLCEAEKQYVGENDILSGFIASNCKVVKDDKVDTTEFREAFQRATDTKITPATMKAKMNARGFPLERKRAPGQGQKQMFVGVILC